MTTFATPAATVAPARTRTLRPGAFAAVREWAHGWTHAFRAAAAYGPRQEGMDPTALRMFGRD